ncbi:MAG: hypothetical protein ACTS7I_02075 [Candidatus Hodgkinia cicadicola]
MFRRLTAELRIWRFVRSTLRNRFTLSCRRRATLKTYNPLTSDGRSCLNQSGGLWTRNLRSQSSAGNVILRGSFRSLIRRPRSTSSN